MATINTKNIQHPPVIKTTQNTETSYSSIKNHIVKIETELRILNERIINIDASLQKINNDQLCIEELKLLKVIKDTY